MPDPTSPASDVELRPLVERALSAHYDLERELGRGGMGIVYQARDRRLKRTVAIKVLPPELGFRAEIRSRFLREAETAAQLNHPNIVPIYAVDEREGLVYFVMACVAGVTLARALADGAREGDRLPAGDARRVLAEVADALAYAHARGVVHRDIKPDNILLDGETGRALVTDFGIARAVQESGDTRLTATGMAIGTPAFMSPEQALGERALDGRSDLYSLGVVGYLMLAGALPFTAASTPSMLLKHVSETPVPLGERCPEVPEDLAAAVMLLLEKEPEQRFASAAALARALRGEGGTFVAPRGGESVPARGGAGDGAIRRATGGAPVRAASPVASRAAQRAARRASRTGGETAAEVALTDGGDVARELALRWEAEPVRHFRRRLGYFVAVNSVILIGTLFGSRDFTSITLLWSIYLAYRYAKLWERGYDWRDVLRQPRDRRLGDVLSEWADDVRHVARRVVRGHEAGAPSQHAVDKPAAAHAVPAPAAPAAALPAAEGARGHRTELMARARADREEIARLVRSLPRRDRAVVGDVLPAADALLDRMQELARGVAVLERGDDRGALARVDGEIARLEAAANPLEAGSEGRVRQLAALKRERLALLAAGARREQAEGRLAVCALALENVRLDVLRLRAGQVVEAAGWITQLTERARAVARDVDAAVPAEGAAVPRAGAGALPTDSRAP